MLSGERTREQALERYGTSRRRTRWKFAWLKRWQDHIWQVRPHPRDALVRSLRSHRLAKWSFGHYLRVAPPEFALPAPPAARVDASAQIAA